MRLYRAWFAVGGASNVIDRHAFHGTQQQCLALRARQMANARRYTFQPLPSKEVFLLSRFRITNFVRTFLLRHRSVKTNQPAPQRKSAIAIMVAHQIDCDPRQPGERLTFAAEPFLLLKCADEALLRKLLRQIGLACLRQYQPINALLIEPDEFVKVGER